MSIRMLIALTLALGLSAPAAAAAAPEPLSRSTATRDLLVGPCLAGAVYDPACDVDHDGDVDIFDVQTTAGHWNQTGVWLSDNNHTHLGQTWTGNNNPLRIDGSFASGSNNVALWVSNAAQESFALRGETSAPDSVGVHGVSEDGRGVWGVSDSGAGVHGQSANGVGVSGESSAAAGVYGVSDDGAGVEGQSTSGPAISGESTSGIGVNVVAGSHGVVTESTNGDGVRVTAAGDNGLHVHSAVNDALFVYSTNASGLMVLTAGNNGVYVASAGNYGLNVTGNNLAGYFSGNVQITGSCTGCLLATFGVNAGDRPLAPGDLVSLAGLQASGMDSAPMLMQVQAATGDRTVVGVVAGRADLVAEQEPRPTETGLRLVPRQGAAQPGQYVAIAYSGVTQARASGPLEAGARLTSGDHGRARALQTRTLDGMTVSEGAQPLGIALEPLAAEDGLIWVLLAVQ